MDVLLIVIRSFMLNDRQGTPLSYLCGEKAKEAYILDCTSSVVRKSLGVQLGFP